MHKLFFATEANAVRVTWHSIVSHESMMGK